MLFIIHPHTYSAWFIRIHTLHHLPADLIYSLHYSWLCMHTYSSSFMTRLIHPYVWLRECDLIYPHTSLILSIIHPYTYSSSFIHIHFLHHLSGDLIHYIYSPLFMTVDMYILTHTLHSSSLHIIFIIPQVISFIIHTLHDSWLCMYIYSSSSLRILSMIHTYTCFLSFILIHTLYHWSLHILSVIHQVISFIIHTVHDSWLCMYTYSSLFILTHTLHNSSLYMLFIIHPYTYSVSFILIHSPLHLPGDVIHHTYCPWFMTVHVYILSFIHPDTHSP